MSSDEALHFVAACGEQAVAISNVDGFHVVKDGYMEDVDLLFSIDEGCSPAEAASAAGRFILENGGPDIVWEVWLPDQERPVN